MGRQKTTEEFKVEVFNLVGDEYQVIGEYVNNHTKIKILHKKCGNTYYVTPLAFLSSNRCPFCCKFPQKVGFSNCMWSTNSELAKLLLNPEDGYKHTQCSNKKADWKCPYCGYIIKNKNINDINRRGLSCPQCNDGISYPNRLMASVLSYLNIEFEAEKRFKWCRFYFNNKLKQGVYDFYFLYENKEYIIEMDGNWHFNDNKMNGQTKEESRFIDLQKDRLAREHNIIPIRITSDKSEMEYIKSEILTSELKNILDLSKIDWQECHKQSLTSLKIQACELWKKHHSTKIISTIMKRHQSTIIAWLKSCATADLCDYNPVIEIQNRVLKIIRKVVCVETNEIFDSITVASRTYNVDRSCISDCCRGEHNYAGKLPDGTKLHWKYA